MEWKRNGRKKQKSSGNKVNRNGMELEKKWNGKLSIEKKMWNGMEKNSRNQIEAKLYGMEWKWI